MGNGVDASVTNDFRETLALMRRTARELSRANDKLVEASDSSEAWNLSRAASVAQETLHQLADDLEGVLDGGVPVRRVPMIPTGLPWKEDAGGGFGHRAIHALAVCREAWTVADASNAPRMERAIAAIMRAWLETCGRDRAPALRAVVSHKLDAGRQRDEFVARVEKLAAQPSAEDTAGHLTVVR